MITDFLVFIFKIYPEFCLELNKGLIWKKSISQRLAKFYFPPGKILKFYKSDPLLLGTQSKKIHTRAVLKTTA